MKFLGLRRVVAVAMLAWMGAANAQVDVNSFVRQDEFEDVQISPDGKVSAVPSDASSGLTPDVVRAGANVVLTWLTDVGVQLQVMAAPEADA